jgi:hypothetical protein
MLAAIAAIAPDERPEVGAVSTGGYDQSHSLNIFTPVVATELCAVGRVALEEPFVLMLGELIPEAG